MILKEPHRIELNTDALALQAAVVPWDSEVFGCPVASISQIEIKSDQRQAVQADFDRFRHWLDAQAIGIASCRLPHDRLHASMLLEHNDFKFIEMVLHPIMRLDTSPMMETILSTETGLVVAQADEDDLSVLTSLAGQAFGYERYHVDPRLDSSVANLRYARWVKNSFCDPKQRLLKIALDGQIVGMFVVENTADNTAYWHLTAVHPDFQGRQLGYRAWVAMIQYHQRAGISSVCTTITARNSRVLGLYAKLSFRFTEPDMTFHWVRSEA